MPDRTLCNSVTSASQNVDTDRQVQRAITIGEANKRVLELVEIWCAHLTVEKEGWGGLVEQMSGLPIGPRSLTCPYASATGFSGMDLRFIALDFYDRNCAGCAHRRPVRLPNLSELVHERDQATAAAAAESARSDAAAASALRVRDAKRQALRVELDPLSADVIDQIEQLDRQRTAAVADHLVGTAKLAPDVFTPPVVEYLFGLIEGGESWFDSQAFECWPPYRSIARDWHAAHFSASPAYLPPKPRSKSCLVTSSSPTRR
jgi:hypothetical protein